MQDYCDAEYQPPIKPRGFMDDVEQKNLQAGYHLVSNENACAVVCAVLLPPSGSVFEAGETVGQTGFYGISRIKLKSGADVERVGGGMRGKCSALTTEWVSE